MARCLVVDVFSRGKGRKPEDYEPIWLFSFCHRGAVATYLWSYSRISVDLPRFAVLRTHAELPDFTKPV